MSANKRISARRHQQGAALLEFALTFTVFLLVVLGTMELALTYFAWNRVSEAARDGARHLIVSSPLADLSTQSCSASAPAAITVNCSDGSCATLLSRLQAHAPFVAADRVSVQYSCSGAGNPSAPDENRVRTVTLSISGVPHPQVITALTGLGWTGPPELPAVSVTRTGEDLYTPAL
jgi:Flp pilus assembly protein TadG